MSIYTQLLTFYLNKESVVIKTYSENIFQKKRQRINIVLYVGWGIAVGCGVIGTLHEYKFLTVVGVGILVAAGIISTLMFARVMMNFIQCAGGVFEVESGRVIAYHEKPFVYDKRTFRGAELVPLRQLPISVEKTLRLPVYGIILSYRLVYSARINNFQRFYDAFLHPDKKRLNEPESVLRTCAAVFLQQNKRNIVDLCMDEFAHIPLETRGEHVEHVTRNNVETYLQDELKAYGMCLCDVFTSCSLKPVVIE